MFVIIALSRQQSNQKIPLNSNSSSISPENVGNHEREAFQTCNQQNINQCWCVSVWSNAYFADFYKRWKTAESTPFREFAPDELATKDDSDDDDDGNDNVPQSTERKSGRKSLGFPFECFFHSDWLNNLHYSLNKGVPNRRLVLAWSSSVCISPPSILDTK